MTNPELRATPIEADKNEYNADVFKNEEKRKESAGEIKKKGGYDKNTEE